tara:strand:- start:213 stop:476 length:264 start_codon:yes stop_codon:yes gene_type:complete
MSDSYIIAYVAGSICFVTSLPQLHQIITTKKVRDLNPYFFALHSTSDVLYIVYGVLVDDYFLATSMSLSAFCNILILILWFVYKNNE